MKQEKDKTLTTRFPTQTMVEFSVAAEILGFRSINALVHQLVMQKIREAKAQVPADEFAAMVEAQKKITQTRSSRKSKERLEMIGALAPQSAKKMPLIEAKAEISTRKKRA